MSLTNLAGLADIKPLVDAGARDIGHLMFSDNEMVKRAATECLGNLVPAEKVRASAVERGMKRRCRH